MARASSTAPLWSSGRTRRRICLSHQRRPSDSSTTVSDSRSAPGIEPTADSLVSLYPVTSASVPSHGRRCLWSCLRRLLSLQASEETRSTTWASSAGSMGGPVRTTVRRDCERSRRGPWHRRPDVPRTVARPVDEQVDCLLDRLRRTLSLLDERGSVVPAPAEAQARAQAGVGYAVADEEDRVALRELTTALCRILS